MENSKNLLLKRLYQSQQESFRLAPSQSNTYLLNKDLIHNNYEIYPFKTLQCMVKARCEGLNLNFRPYGSVAEVQCCMRNMFAVLTVLARSYLKSEKNYVTNKVKKQKLLIH